MQTTSYASKASQDVAPRTPSFTGSIFTSQENFADNDDIWDDILQAAAVAAKPGQPEVSRCSGWSGSAVYMLLARTQCLP